MDHSSETVPHARLPNVLFYIFKKVLFNNIIIRVEMECLSFININFEMCVCVLEYTVFRFFAER